MTAVDHADRTPWSMTSQGLGMVVFLASDVMLFAPFFAAYYLLRSVNDVWPSPDAELDTTRAALATAALVASSVALIAGERAFQAGDRARYRNRVLVALGLGSVFLINQLVEYAGLTLRPSTDAYGSIYWLLTGIHALHVTVGLVLLAILAYRASRSTPRASSVRSEVSAFWHLVDVVWLAVFVTIWVVR